MKICVDSRVNVNILASTSVPFILTTVQVPKFSSNSQEMDNSVEVVYTEETSSTVAHTQLRTHPFCAGYKEESSIDICMEYDKTDCRRY